MSSKNINTLVTRKIREENRGLQTAILNRFLKKLNTSSELDENYFDTDDNMRKLEVVLKLELKDQQIETQKELGGGVTNNLFMTVVAQAVHENNLLRKKPRSKLEEELVLEVEATEEKEKENWQKNLEQPIAQ